MLGPLIIYPLWIICCIAGVARPWIGVVAFYGCVLLEPNWNWRWTIPEDFAFQKFLALSTIVGFVLNGFPGNRFDKPQRVALGSLLVFLALAYASAFQTIDSTLTSFFMGNMWKIVLMSLLAARLLDSPKKITTFLLVMVFTQGYNALQINEYYFTTGINQFAYRPWGFKGDNNLYSNLTVPVIAASAACSIYSINKWVKLACFAVMILQLHQLMLLESRGAMLSVAVVAPYFLWLMPKTKTTIKVLLIAGVLVAALAGPPVIREFSSIFAAEQQRDSSAASRYKLWRAGVEITKDHPLLGVGPYAAQRLVPRYYEGGEQMTIKGLHNMVFQVTAGCGIPAAIFYFLFYIIPWWYCRKLYKLTRFDPGSPDWLKMATLAITTALPAYLLASMFSSAALLEPPYALAATGIAIMCIINTHPASIIQMQHEPNTLKC